MIVWWDRITGWLLWLVGAFIIAGIVHICSVLAMPRFAPLDSYARMERITPLGRLTPLPLPLPGRELAPFEDPAMAAAAAVTGRITEP